MTLDDLTAVYPWSLRPVARVRQEQRLSLIEDYLFIGGDRMSAAQAAARLGVTERTVCRYRAVLRAWEDAA